MMWNNSGIVRVPVMRLKEHPFSSARTADEVLYGMAVLIREKVSKDWALLETAYGYRGYGRLSDLENREWSVRRWQKAVLYMVVSPSADVYEAPGYQDPYLFSLPRGSLVAAGDPEGRAGWCRVRLADGRGAYMRRGQLRPADALFYSVRTEEDKLRESLVRTAMSYLHTPYRWGGKTPWGIDCSGLCSMVYLLHGIHIYRDAGIREGYPVKEIPVCRMKPGDLLYFPGHMALYTGRLEYIHATGRAGEDGVVISSLDHRAPGYRADLASSVTAAGTVFGQSLTGAR